MPRYEVRTVDADPTTKEAEFYKAPPEAVHYVYDTEKDRPVSLSTSHDKSAVERDCASRNSKAAEDAGLPVHRFGDTWEAYDATQCRDDIADGHVLVIESEQVVGFLVDAWPVAITEEHGQFHGLTARVSEFREGRYLASAARAAELAGELGFPLRQPAQTA
ncbi:hypothetical protein [Streptomyces sp. NBC_01800]|uniref:hypothetical protein n=1 Tax=Streptomyces sp. NBC_01800 TaxID=2975945 RepID=UPI002DD8B797|nr:hypothetical protein [Streptomyces sp. NBC_01800]WSA68817.1 hypothetical protein OIE65_18525 [Streptomyces sp. NBC_01800]